MFTASLKATADKGSHDHRRPPFQPVNLAGHGFTPISFSFGLFSYNLIMNQMKQHTTHRVLPQGATHRLLSKDPFRVSFYPSPSRRPVYPRAATLLQVACRAKGKSHVA